MEYINIERNTYDGNDCDEKCYYGIVYNDNDKVVLFDVVFGKADALRYYVKLDVDIPKDKECEMTYPKQHYSLIKISSRLGVQFIKDMDKELDVYPIVTLKLTQFGELYGDVTVSGGLHD